MIELIENNERDKDQVSQLKGGEREREREREYKDDCGLLCK